MKILIVTALLKEQKAFIEKMYHSGDGNDLQKISLEKIGISNKHNNDLFDVRIVSLKNVGNIESAIKTTQGIFYFNPDFVILSGICGGFKTNPSVKLGDIIIADKIIYYEYAKINNKQNDTRFVEIDIDRALISAVKAFIKNDWSKFVSTKNKNTYPQIHINPIASGEKVVADDAFQQELLNHYHTLIGIEMEGYGVGTAVIRSGKPIKFLVIKSIADWADKNKNDDWHDYATKISAEFVIYLIRNINFNFLTGPSQGKNDKIQ